MTSNTNRLDGAMMTTRQIEHAFATAVIQQMAELCDRNSPEDEPDAMIANAEEMHGCIERALEQTGYLLSASKPAAIDISAESAERRAEYWKSEHIAANREIERLQGLLTAFPAAPSADAQDERGEDEDDYPPTPESERAAFNAMMRWHLIRLLQAWRYGGDLRAAGMAAFEWARSNDVGKDAFKASEKSVKLAASPSANGTDAAAPAQSGELVAWMHVFSEPDGSGSERLFRTSPDKLARFRLCSRIIKCDYTVIPLYAAPQSSQPVEAGDDYNTRAKNWRDSFDAMHRRAMRAEERLAVVDDLAMLIKKLVRHVRKASPDNSMAEMALDYLRRHGLEGSPLRIDPSAVVLDDGRAAFEVCATKAGYGDFRRDPHERERYLLDEVQSAWAVWQARATSPQATATQPAQTERALTDDERNAIEVALAWVPRRGAPEVHEVLRALLTAAHPASGGAA